MTWSLSSSRTRHGASLSCVGLRGGGCVGGGEWRQSQPRVRDSSRVAVSLSSGAARWPLWCVTRCCFPTSPGRNRHSEENELLMDSPGGAKAVKTRTSRVQPGFQHATLTLCAQLLLCGTRWSVSLPFAGLI